MISVQSAIVHSTMFQLSLEMSSLTRRSLALSSMLKLALEDKLREGERDTYLDLSMEDYRDDEESLLLSRW